MKKILNTILIVCMIVCIILSIAHSKPDPIDSKALRNMHMPGNRINFGSVELNGKIYNVGGKTDSLNEYDPKTNTWTWKKRMPTARENLGVVAVDGKIYTIGGECYGSCNIVEEYDPKTDIWTTKSSMPTPRSSLGVVALNGKIYAIGGEDYTTEDDLYNIIEVYDPKTDTWTTKSSMPTPRSELGVVAINGKIYAIGGFGHTNDEKVGKLVEAYDPNTDTWTKKTDMPTARHGMGVIQLNEKIYTIGGEKADSNSGCRVVEEYSPKTDTWTERSYMLKGREDFGVAAVNGKIYAMGGYHSGGTIEEYNPLTDQWIIGSRQHGCKKIASIILDIAIKFISLFLIELIITVFIIIKKCMNIDSEKNIFFLIGSTLLSTLGMYFLPGTLIFSGFCLLLTLSGNLEIVTYLFFMVFFGGWVIVLGNYIFDEFNNSKNEVPENSTTIDLTKVNKYDETVFNKGCDLLKNKKYAKSIFYFDKEILQNPKSHLGYVTKAASLIGLKKYNEALIYCNKGIEISPTFIESYKYKSTALLSLNKYEEALECINEIIKIDSELVDNDYIVSKTTWGNMHKFKIELFQYVNTLITSKNFEKALQILNKLEQTFKNDGSIHYQKGNRFYAMSDYENAYKNYHLATSSLKKTDSNYKQALLNEIKCAELLNKAVTPSNDFDNIYDKNQMDEDNFPESSDKPVESINEFNTTVAKAESVDTNIKEKKTKQKIWKIMIGISLFSMGPGKFLQVQCPSSFRSDAIIGFLFDFSMVVFAMFMIASPIAFLLELIISKYLKAKMKKISMKISFGIVILSLILAIFVYIPFPSYPFYQYALEAAPNIFSKNIQSEFAIKEDYIFNIHSGDDPYINIQQGDKQGDKRSDIKIYVSRKDYPKLSAFKKNRKYKIYYYPHTRICVNYEGSDFNRACDLIENENYEKAVLLLDQEIKNTPKRPYPYIAKACALFNLENYDEAIKCCNTAIKINFNFPESYFYKGYSLLALEKYEQAQECVNRMLKFDLYDEYVSYTISVEDINDLNKKIGEAITSSLPIKSDTLSTKSSAPVHEEIENIPTVVQKDKENIEDEISSMEEEKVRKKIEKLDHLLDQYIDIDNNYFKKGNLLYSINDYENAYDAYYEATMFLDKSDYIYGEANYQKSLCAALTNKPIYAAGALKAAIEFDEHYKNLAEKEQIFDNIRNSTYFKWLWDQEEIRNISVKTEQDEKNKEDQTSLNDEEKVQKKIEKLDNLIENYIDAGNNYFEKGNLLYSIKDYENAYDAYDFATIYLDKSDFFYAENNYKKSLCAALINKPAAAAGALKSAIESDKKYKDLAEKEQIFDDIRDSTYFKWLWDQLE